MLDGGGGSGLVTMSCLTLETPWTATHQALPAAGLPWQGYWSELPFPSPGDVPNSGIQPKSLQSPALADGFFTARLLAKHLLDIR